MPYPKQTMNKIDAGSIRVYRRQMVGLAATSEMHSVPVCDFMLFYDGYIKEASSKCISIYHSVKPSTPWFFPI